VSRPIKNKEDEKEFVRGRQRSQSANFIYRFLYDTNHF